MGVLTFHYVDLLVVAVVAASAWWAATRGFVAETLSIFAWAAAAFATLYFAPSAVPLLAGAMSPVFAQLAAYVGVFLLVLIPLSFISARFAEGVQNSPVGALDQALGGVFGVLRGLIVIAMAYLLFTLVIPIKKQPDWIAKAWTLPVVQDTGYVLLSLVPEHDSKIFGMGPAKSEPATSPPQLAQEPQPKPKPMAAKSHVKKVQKSYGARERKALDSLIQATGDGKQP